MGREASVHTAAQSDSDAGVRVSIYRSILRAYQCLSKQSEFVVDFEPEPRTEEILSRTNRGNITEAARAWPPKAEVHSCGPDVITAHRGAAECGYDADSGSKVGGKSAVPSVRFSVGSISEAEGGNTAGNLKRTSLLG